MSERFQPKLMIRHGALVGIGIRDTQLNRWVGLPPNGAPYLTTLPARAQFHARLLNEAGGGPASPRPVYMAELDAEGLR